MSHAATRHPALQAQSLARIVREELRHFIAPLLRTLDQRLDCHPVVTFLETLQPYPSSAIATSAGCLASSAAILRLLIMLQLAPSGLAICCASPGGKLAACCQSQAASRCAGHLALFCQPNSAADLGRQCA